MSADDPRSDRRAYARHLEARAVVLPDLRIVYAPVPKAACTSLLWLLAELAGVRLEAFGRSTLPSPTAAMTVHDMSLWPDWHRFSHYTGEERERILTEDGWLRFSVVRNPGPRLWSAWVSKLLFREPRFAFRFEEKPWFPGPPGEPLDLVVDFRRFAAALGKKGPHDVHWAPQHELLDRLSLGHIGRVEQLGETLTLLREHVGEARWSGEARRENRTVLPMPGFAFDEPTARRVNAEYARDYELYGYAPMEASPDAHVTAWAEQVAPLLPFVVEVRGRNDRIAQLHRTLRPSQGEPETRNGSKPAAIQNLEGEAEFDVRWAWADGILDPGFTAVVRVKNEARSLPWVIPPLLRAVRRVVLVDNGSTDGSADIARDAAAEIGAGDRLEVLSYPFDVARCGPEHLSTPAESVHSLTYFYNWSFAQVRTQYALKWDGDMVMSDGLVSILRDLEWQLEGKKRVVVIPRVPLYVADDRRGFVETSFRNAEPWGWPNAPGYEFYKGFEWELCPMPARRHRLLLPDWLCIELKHLDAHEFSNWSHTDFGATTRTERKEREWSVFRALATGDDPPEGVVAVEASAGEHVIDFVRSRWLPSQAAEAQRT